MASSSVGQACGNCYGEGQIPTDDGPARCPDCGGAGVLPTSNVLVEWRAAEIERLHGAAGGGPGGGGGSGGEQIAQDVRWLVFELRRARMALTKLLALAEEIPDDEPLTHQLRFIANEALGMYPIDAQRAAGPEPSRQPGSKSPPTPTR